MQHTKVQVALLNTLRATLRHVKQHCNARAPGAVEGPPDASQFTRFILSEYRRGAQVKDRASVRQLRAQASDILNYFKATLQQNKLLTLQRGSDPDKEMARTAAARFVGLSIPDGIPLGASSAPDKYQETLQKRLSGALEDTKLEGVDYLKAQYFGAQKVLEDKK